MAQVLLIEDDELLSLLYIKSLEGKVYTVAAARDGEEGLRLALTIHPEVVVLDLHLPKLDGMAVLSSLRKDEWGKSAKVIILTAQEPTDSMLKEILEYGPAFYLFKSNTSPDELCAKVAEVLRH